MKIKWNWLDTVIVIIVILVIAAACFFLFGNKNNDAADDQEIIISFNTLEGAAGKYEPIKVGDEIGFADTGVRFGVIENVEFLPYETSVFNEQTKEYELDQSKEIQFCRVTVKAKGFRNANGELYVCGRRIMFREECYLETTAFRFLGYLSAVGGEQK